MDYVELGFKRPYEVSEIQWRKGFKGGKDLAYLDARQVANRFDKIVGMFCWQDSYVETPSGMKICTIQKVRGSRMGYWALSIFPRLFRCKPYSC